MYWSDKSIIVNRPFILNILRNFAILYRLDYATSVEHSFYNPDSSNDLQKNQNPTDIIYFRSNSDTRISKKDFRKVIGLTFDKTQNTQFGLIDLGFQMVSALKEYPFPSEFYRPLNYPHIEHHIDGKSTHKVFPEALNVILENQQDETLN